MQPLTVLKVGGKILEEEQTLHDFLTRFAAIPGRKVLVHGGGRSATRLAEKMGVETKMVDGRRITDHDMLRIVTMVYGGLVNKTVVAQLQARGINALGLTGADMDIIRSHKRPVLTIDYGFVGDVDYANGTQLTRLIEAGIVPVLAPLTHNGQGQLFNTNADTIASEAAKALAPHFDVTLMYCFEKPGVLSDADNDQSVIPHITRTDFQRLTADGIVSGGMIPKLENAFQATAAGVRRVIITQSTAIDGQHGTVITE